MSALNEEWLQEVVRSIKLPALSPSITKMLLPLVEMHVRKIVQQAHKFQRRAKSQILTVDDINLALSMNRIEPVYGLSRAALLLNSSSEATESTNAGSSTNRFTKANKNLLDLVEFGKTPLPPCPLQTEVSLHWLAVKGSQPMTAENPSVQSTAAEDQPLALPKEMQLLYARITGIILANAQEVAPGLTTVLKVLRSDVGMQELTPYLSRFFYQHIRNNTKRLPLLNTIIKSSRALLQNSNVVLDFHLQQFLPAIFTCVVAAKLCTFPAEDHWSLRENAADLISKIVQKFSYQFPDLLDRVCKTYLEALAADKPLHTVFGGILGLAALAGGCGGSSAVGGSSGDNSVIGLLLEQLPQLQKRLVTGYSAVAVSDSSYGAGSSSSAVTSGSEPMVIETQEQSRPVKKRKTSSGSGSSSSGSRSHSQATLLSQMEEQLSIARCRGALATALGRHLMHCLRLPRVSGLRQQQRGGGNSGLLSGYPLCDLEEALVPYYCSTSKEDYYCRLLI